MLIKIYSLLTSEINELLAPHLSFDCFYIVRNSLIKRQNHQMCGSIKHGINNLDLKIWLGLS